MLSSLYLLTLVLILSFSSVFSDTNERPRAREAGLLLVSLSLDLTMPLLILKALSWTC